GAGGIDPGMGKYKRILEKRSEKLGITYQIIWAGSLSLSEMSWCYHNCSVFIMTSRAEACPNIALEAMAHGCVCISTKTPPMPEFFKNAAVYYPPKDGETLADAIQTIFTWDNNQRKVMSEKARKRAAEFSWDVCVEKTVNELAKVARR
ncbi:glycosyltransferase, partial [bacterium]|nr:glycosyltransferase [bacterium]